MQTGHSEMRAKTGIPTTLMFALFHITLTQLHCGNYAMATSLNNELAALSEEKGSLHWQLSARSNLGCILALSGDGLGAIQVVLRRQPCDIANRPMKFGGGPCFLCGLHYRLAPSTTI
jgi:hypothetical protein